MPNYSRLAATALFLTSGTLHFLKPEIFKQIVPPALPNAAALVAISGAAELAGAVGINLPRLRRPAAFGLILLLVSVFPANVYMALEAKQLASVAPAWLLYARLPFQAVLIAWIWKLRA